MKKVFLVFLILIIAAVLWSYRIYDIFTKTPISSNPKTAIIEVPEGTSCRKIAAILKDKGVISNAFLFKIMVTLEKKATILKAGEYEIRYNLSPYEIMGLLVKGEARRYYITFPEGITNDYVADRLESKGLINRKLFLSLTRDRKFIKLLGFDAPSLEGYLFPDTYAFTKRSGERFILTTMTDRLKKALTPALQAMMKERNFTLHQTLTLASMIEEEAHLKQEREMVSAVFHNRLHKKMLLQCDPTVMYALKKSSPSITRADLNYNSPYNTYKYTGLPPGPIGNPGEDCIKAALTPAKVGYLFFVVSGNGAHKFSNTYAEHLVAVNNYRMMKKASEDATN